jgi:hypothetical protein
MKSPSKVNADAEHVVHGVRQLRAMPVLPKAKYSSCFASPLKWLLNGSSRAAPGLGTPLDELDQGHDD